ncbi:Centrosomal protein of 295 kDa [Galemys pyrenaicus]|uniref:Centrosomal protein of 295 kDa n=1 Tax=Galemys pyrenaicus TaxID=202257 RepID=A0A8J6BEV9_GALPY|nr:Centrosomal protein of 295 kDa [Galemys pyrenaicus]
MKELEQLQQEDLARRRRTVARMPAQLVELPYKRGQMREDWQRELEFAFEDMYSADRSKATAARAQRGLEVWPRGTSR